MINAQERQNAIKKIIEKHEVKSQEHLMELLQTLYGIETSQAMISRDLQALGIARHRHQGKLIYEKQQDPTREILRLAILSIEHNETMIVIHTLCGLAAFIGDFFDMHKSIGIMGTLAGENIVFITPKSTKEIKVLIKKIKDLLK